MEKGGIPLFFMKLDPKALEIDPMLVSSFFTAIQTFSAEVIDRSASQFQVDYGARLFTIFSGETADLVAVSIGKWNEEHSSVLVTLLTDFEVNRMAKLTREELDTIDVYTHFEPFREKVIESLTFREIADDWVPLLVKSDQPEDSAESPITQFFDGIRTISEITELSGLSRDIVLQEIAHLWIRREVRFHNMLDTNDIVISTPKLTPILQSSSSERKMMQSTHPELESIIPRLASLLDGRRSVGEIVEVLSELHQEKDLFIVFDYLLDREAIEPLSLERRRTLLVKEALEIAYRVAEKIYDRQIATSALQEVLKTAASEVIGEIRLEGGEWKVEYESKIYDGMDNQRIMGLYAEWMKILAKFVSCLDKQKIKKYIEQLVSEFQTYLFKWYNEYDFLGFEEFSFWLEHILHESG